MAQGAIDDQIRARRACGDIFTAFKFSQSLRYDRPKRPVPAMIWFAISFCGVFYLYKFCGAKPVSARIGIFAVAFVGGFFTSVLYYGFFNSQTLEFAFTYALFRGGFYARYRCDFVASLKFSPLLQISPPKLKINLARFCRISKFIRAG